MERSEIPHHFEELVARIFARRDFKVETEATRRRTERFEPIVDLILSWGNVRTVVEVKAYRTRTPSLSDIGRAAVVLANARVRLEAQHAILAISLRRDQLPTIDLVPEDVTLIGLDDLIALAGEDTELLSELANIARELNSGLGDFDRPTDISPARSPVDVAMFRMAGGSAGAPPPPPDKGARLAAELVEIEAGKRKKQTLSSGRAGTNWVLFEDVCYEAIQYVFEDEFGGWHKQQPVGGENNRFDAMAKVQGDDVFCRTLIEDFRSRYILFEFKNYFDKLLPNLVYITEKYLFPSALRSTAIFISPEGLSPGAIAATQGALRDAGKLLLDVPVSVLCEMLVNKDRGGSGTETMEVVLDRFLQSLGR